MPHYMILRRKVDSPDEYIYLTSETDIETASRALVISSFEFDCILVELLGEAKDKETRFKSELTRIDR